MTTPDEEGGLSEEQRQAIAVDVLRRLSGYRWSYPEQTVTEEYPLPSSRRVFLTGRPVREIHAVRLDGSETDNWKLYNGWQLQILRTKNRNVHPIAPQACSAQTQVEVEYTYGMHELPPLLQRAVDVYAEEIRLAENNDPHCKIPERVTSVTRNGISWTLLDPQEFMSDGRTGIYEVDMALRVYNPGRAKARARIFTASNPPARRRTL